MEKKNENRKKNNENSNLLKNIRKSYRLRFGKSIEEKKEKEINIERKESNKGDKNIKIILIKNQFADKKIIQLY